MAKRKYSSSEIIIPPIPKGSTGDTLAGCAHRDLIGIPLGSGVGAPK